MVTNVLGTEHRSLFEPAEERSRLNQTFDRRKTKSRHLTKFPVHIFGLRDALTLDTQMASGLKIERTARRLWTSSSWSKRISRPQSPLRYNQSAESEAARQLGTFRESHGQGVR